jgi:Asp-tRNA(Asn)/Glu-tRNA(Gln) amidotransferase C subunit
MDKEEIKKQAKEIMDNFASALEKVKVEEGRVEREADRREEKRGEEADSDFRKIMFENAPEKEGDCIKAEKGGWVE